MARIDIPTPDATTTYTGKVELAGDLGGTATAPTVPGLIQSYAGPLEIHGHSYTAGANLSSTGTDYFEQMGMIGRLASMLKVNDTDLRHYGTSGSYLTRTGNAFVQTPSGWATLLQMAQPNNATNITTTVNPNLNTGSNGVFVLVHGVNDYQFNTTSWGTIGLNAWKHALRTYISRARAGALWCSKSTTGTLTWDSIYSTTGTWANTQQIFGNTGGGYRQSTDFATPATLSITLPADWPGGKLAVCFLAQQQGYTTVASMTSGAASMTVAANSSFPTSGTLVANIAADGSGGTREEVLVTSGLGTNTWNITRAQNGTSASAHTAAVVTIATDTIKVNVSTDAVSGAGLFTSATGSINLSGQGVESGTGVQGAGGPIPVTTRFDTIQADAGKKITFTLAGLVTGDTSATVKFDSAWLESPRPRPVLVTNMQRFAPFGTNAVSDLATMNTATAAVVAEFDNMVKVVDVDTYMYNRSGVANGATGVGTTIAFTANDKTTFDTLMNAGKGFRMSMPTEDIYVKSIAYVSGNNYTLTVTRAYSTGSATSKADQTPISYAATMHTDQVHPNTIGHAFYAQTIYDTLKTITVPDSYTIAEASGVWTQMQKQYIMPAKNGNWYQPNVSTYAATAQAVQNVSWVPVFIPKEGVFTDIMCSVSTLNAGSTIEMGVYDVDSTGQRPGALIFSAGTISGGTANARTISNLAVRYRGGLCWLAFLQTGTAATVRTIANNGLNFPQIPTSNPITATSVIGMVNGYIQTGQATLPANATPTEVSGTIAAGNCVAVVAVKFATTQAA
jgi:hypothetical protein